MRLHFISFAIIFILVGIMFFLNHGLDKIKGWREMSDEEKSEINSQKLSQAIGIIFLSIGFIFFASYLNAWFREKLFIWLFIAWMFLCAALVFTIQKTGIFKKK